jgi:hypothetical protein
MHTDGREFYFNSSLNKSAWQVPRGETILGPQYANTTTHVHYESYNSSSAIFLEGNGSSAPLVDQSKE